MRTRQEAVTRVLVLNVLRQDTAATSPVVAVWAKKLPFVGVPDASEVVSRASDRRRPEGAVQTVEHCTVVRGPRS